MNPIIAVESVVKRFRKRRAKEVVTAVDGVSFTVRRGEIVGLLGANGAGKTTTLKMICGLITPDAGRIRVAGHDIQRQRPRALAHISAVLEGNRNLYWRLTARENLEYFAGNRGFSRRAVKGESDRLLALFKLEPKADELVNNLSRGMQQKLAIAVAMLAGTEVVLLDEPTLGLDVETGYEVRELLRQIAFEGRTVLLSTHDMPVVQDLCERSVIIHQGRVIADDRIENLLRLFESRAYAITLGAPLTAEQLRRMNAAFPGVRVEGTSLHVDLAHGEEIYDLIDILKLARTPVQAIDRTTINFEEVFRRLIGGEAPAAKAEAVHA